MQRPHREIEKHRREMKRTIRGMAEIIESKDDEEESEVSESNTMFWQVK